MAYVTGRRVLTVRPNATATGANFAASTMAAPPRTLLKYTYTSFLSGQVSTMRRGQDFNAWRPQRGGGSATPP
ncbi:hypothetical protein ABZS99_47370 [Streptomyces sp. NPDC005463]|uniref:hypothetical protein n=1 Tax=Streptomyces sp. NPDC005463 TaxID=3154465 RepID=UPI00339ED9A4